MNIVTFETAVKLKAAGFPQPEPQRGQAWYFVTWRQYQDGREQELAWDAHWLRNNMHEGKGGVVFAPTATDILFHLNGHTLDYFHQRWRVKSPGYSYSSFGRTEYVAGDIISEHENSTEAAALAYLEKAEEMKKIKVGTVEIWANVKE